jgi:uncharacterized repeat protein (TIGR01451 family)
MGLPRTIALMVFAFAALASDGCYAVSQTSSYSPQSPPAPEIPADSPKAADRTPNADPEQVGVHVEVTALESAGPTKTQFLITAAVTDKYARPRRGRRVDWLVEGVGEVVEVDATGYPPVRGRKVDDHYGVSYTSYTEHTFKADDGREVHIKPGRTWCVVTSAVEGDMRVTISAPDGGDGDPHKVVVTRHWCDAEWRFPPAAACPAGARPSLSTQIIRASDRAPLSNYRVRYRVIDGTPAQLIATSGSVAEVTTDQDGEARVTLGELAVQPGRTRIGIEVIRPDANGPGVVVGRGETTLQWLAPRLSLNVSAPATSVIGADVPIIATVSNTGQTPSQPVLVRMPIPQGAQYVGSDPPAVTQGTQIVWQLSAIPEGASQPLKATFRAASAGVIIAGATAQARDGLQADGQAIVRVANPALRVGIEGARAVAPGETVQFEVSVANTGGGPATNVRVRATFDPALTHESEVRSLEVVVGTLEAGQEQTVPLTLLAAQTGKPAVHVIASGDGDLHAEAARSVIVTQGELQLAITGAPTRFVNRPGTWDVRVANAGDAPLSNVTARVRLPKELRFQSASANGQLNAGEIVWTVGDLRPGEGRDLQLTATPVDGTGQTSLTGVATADKSAPQSAEAPFEIMGVPVLRAEIVPPAEPIPAGGKGIVGIKVTNQGTLVARNVILAVVAPAPFLTPRFGGGPTIGRVQGDRIEFAPVARVEAGQSITFNVDVAANQQGDGRMRVEVRSDSSPTPLSIEDPIRVVAPAPPGRLPVKP